MSGTADSLDRENAVVDWALAQLPAEESAVVSEEVAQDPRATLLAAETLALLADLRGLEVEPSGRVAVAVRYAAARRMPRQHRRAPRRWRLQTARTALIAAAVLAVAALVQIGAPLPPRPIPLPVAAFPAAAATAAISPASTLEPAQPPWPLFDPGSTVAVGRASLGREYRAVTEFAELDGIDPFTRLVRVNNDLAVLRSEFRRRFSRHSRREAIARCGGQPDLEGRIQMLAAHIGSAIRADLAAGPVLPGRTAMALRALLASGSTSRIGHRDAVKACAAALESAVAGLEGGELAMALAGLTDLGIATSGRAAELVRVHAERMAIATLAGPTHIGSDAARVVALPELLQFDTPAAALADAGYVLRLAPAFGSRAGLVREARVVVAAHLRERLHESRGERLEVLTALLYGFEDLVDRDELERRLGLWRPDLIAGRDLVALHHLAWSRMPPRAGWAEFQRDLARLASLPTPSDIRDAAALLLSLATNFAAPGVHRVLGMAG